MKSFVEKNRKKLVFILIILIVIIGSIYAATTVYGINIVSDYEDKLYPNMYVDKFDISNINKENLPNVVADINEQVKNSEVILYANEKEYTYKFSDLGISVNTEKLIKDISNYDNDLNFVEKINKIVTKEKSLFNCELLYSTEKATDFFETLKKKVDVSAKQGKLVMNKNRELSYKKGTNSFALDISENVKLVESHLYNLLTNNKLELIGTSNEPKYDVLSTINTKVATYSTKFDDKISRGRNLEAAAGYIDAVILQPGETFSFYKYAGPYNKKGYVYYGAMMGNGVCQVASTIYNTQLLAGLKTVERYSHESQMDYVKGGLDATVAADARGSKLDFKFKNTYKYPIYISAYTKGGKLTIEFWSNDKAKDGKTYKLESQQIGYKGFKTYSVVYKNGKQIEKNYLTTTWYPK